MLGDSVSGWIQRGTDSGWLRKPFLGGGIERGGYITGFGPGDYRGTPPPLYTEYSIDVTSDNMYYANYVNSLKT